METKAKGDARTAGSNKFPRYVHQNLQANQRHMNPQWQENTCQYISSFKSAYQYPGNLDWEVYTYVCMYACMYVRTYVCRYVCMHVCMYACMYVCTTYVRMYECMRVCMHECMHVCMYVRTYVRM